MIKSSEQQNAYIKTHSCLHHATDFTLNGSDSLGDDRRLADISTRHMDVSASFLKILDETASRLFIKTGAANHFKLLRTTLHHPFGDTAADATKTAGQEIGFRG